MSLSNDMRDKIQPRPLFRNSPESLIWIIIGVQFLIGVCAFPFLPAVVPIHWGANGQPNGYGSKWIDTLLFPLLSLGVYGLVRGLLAAGPRLSGRSGMAANARVSNVLLLAIVLFLLLVQCGVIATALGMNIGLNLIINLGVSVLLIFLGNFMGKIRRNFWMGIRTPWTLASEPVWERTHRVGGWVFVAIGLLGIPFSFIPLLRIWGVVALLILASIFLYVYSYICYRQQTSEGNEPASPPFDPLHEQEE